MTTGMTAAFAEFAARQRFETLPPEVSTAVVVGATDFGACLFGGLKAGVNKTVQQTLETKGVKSEARLYFGKEKASAIEAALANGTAAHASSIDDSAHKGSHVSSVLASAVLAEAEAIDASGRDAITAYTVGYEVWGRLADAEPDLYASKGWHLTTILGPLAVAAAIANLRRCDAATTTYALSTAASFAGGLAANFNPWVKPYQVGRAGSSGILAVRLAMAGMKGSDNAIEAPNGLLNAASPKGRAELGRQAEDLGKNWRIVEAGLNVKRYPIAAVTHRALDGIYALLAERKFTADDVEAIEVRVSGAENRVIKARQVPGHFVAPMSVELSLAAAIMAGEVGGAYLRPDFYEKPEVSTFMKRVTIEETDTLTPDPEPGLGYKGQITVKLKDGSVMTSPDAPAARGHWTNRLTADEMWAKFRGLSAGSLKEPEARAIFDGLQNLPRLASVRQIGAASAMA